MSPRVRVIRFARTNEAAGPEREVVARVLLDESVDAVGVILRSSSGWHYQPTGETVISLTSLHSRQDLERHIVLYHLGPLPAANGDAESASIAKTWFAAAG